MNTTEELNDIDLIALAAKRLKNTNPSQFISLEEVDRHLGFTESDLADFEDVEFE